MLSSVLHSDHAVHVNIEIMRSLRAAAVDARLACRSCAQARDAGEEIRRPIQGGIRRHPRTHDATGAQEETPHRFCAVGRQVSGSYEYMGESIGNISRLDLRFCAETAYRLDVNDYQGNWSLHSSLSNLFLFEAQLF